MLGVRVLDREVARALLRPAGAWGTLVEERAAATAGSRKDAARRAGRVLRLVEVEAADAERVTTGVARARPRARRRARARVARARLRRSGHRQVDAAPDGAALDERGPGASLLVTGEESAAQVKLRADRLGGAGEVADPRGDESRRGLRDARARAAGGVRDRLRPDALRAGARLGSGLGRPGARGHRAAAARSRRRRASRSSSSATSRRTAPSPAPASSSTSSTACSSSRATATARTGFCAQSRTGSARRTSSASSR